MELGLKGKVAMVAAATKGIGLACARELAQEGCRVAICSRHGDEAMRVADSLPGEAFGISCDVSDGDQLESWFHAVTERWEAPQVVVTNTGGPPPGKWTEMTDAQWQAGIDGTLMNVIRTVRLAAPAMRERQWGRFVHVTSLAAKEPSDLLPISSTLRAGIGALVRVQANELAPDGITVNAVLPGHTDTDRQRALAKANAARWQVTEEEAYRRAEQSIPMRRMGTPAEIASAVAFLCSDRAGYITGTNLLVDGGAVSGIA